MRVLASIVAIAIAGGAARADDPRCRGYVEQGLAQRDARKARELFHTARVRCANTVALVMIAKTYQDTGDLPRALAYLEAFLAVAEPGHQARPAVEQAVAQLGPLVPADQRVNITDELGAATAAVNATDSTRARLSGNVEGFDDGAAASPTNSTGSGSTGATGPVEVRAAVTAPRARKLFVGASLAYAPVARVDVTNAEMTGRSEFSAAFAGELQAGYRIRPALGVGLVSQLFFNLRPDGQDAASELELFVQVTAYHDVAPRWELDLFGAPGYSVLLVPGGRNPNGLVLRYGGGLHYRVRETVSVGGELAHQLGFQRTGDADVETSFVSVLLGVRIRP